MQLEAGDWHVIYALFGATVLSVLIALIDVRQKTGEESVTLRSMVGVSFLIYAVLSVVGNSATTLLAVAIVDQADRSLPGVPSFWYAFIGVFGFEVILKNLNITLFDKGALTISDWIKRARDLAVEDALERDVGRREREIQRIAGAIATRDQQELVTHVAHALGSEAFDRLKNEAQRHELDFKLHLALALATAAPDRARAIARGSGHTS